MIQVCVSNREGERKGWNDNWPSDVVSKRRWSKCRDWESIANEEEKKIMRKNARKWEEELQTMKEK